MRGIRQSAQLHTTEVTAITCPRCGDIVYSRARHDFRQCSCGSVAIDGGFDYVKVSADPAIFEDVKQHTITLPVSKLELYEDWNNRTDKFGKVDACGTPLSDSSYS
jgi:hypothetical protein